MVFFITGVSSMLRRGEHQQSYLVNFSQAYDFFFCRRQVYWLALDLHRVGIIHGDLEPQNVARVAGRFCLIDFSNSGRWHTCTEISV